MFPACRFPCAVRCVCLMHGCIIIPMLNNTHNKKCAPYISFFTSSIFLHSSISLFYITDICDRYYYFLFLASFSLSLSYYLTSMYFFPLKGCNDDWFWLYMAVALKCQVVTNDEMRDHHFQMLHPR